jgi:hypothetical protein
VNWRTNRGFLYYCVYLYLDQGQYNQDISAKRNEIFRRELPLASTAIRYGDRLLFDTYPHLDQASIIVNFMSPILSLLDKINGGLSTVFPYNDDLYQLIKG